MPKVDITDYEVLVINKLRQLMKDKKGHIRLDWNEGNLRGQKQEEFEILVQQKLNIPN